jgi:hypothetical protein
LCTDGIPIYIWLLLWYVIVIIFMNKRVEEFALRCGAWHQVYDQKRFMVDRKFDVEQFAELIVRECADIATINAHQWASPGTYVLKHFGAENESKSQEV